MCRGGNTCCNINSKCGLGEGDCDTNVDCMGSGLSGIICGQPGSCQSYAPLYLGYLPSGFSGTDACCILKQEYRQYYKYYRSEIEDALAEL